MENRVGVSMTMVFDAMQGIMNLYVELQPHQYATAKEFISDCWNWRMTTRGSVMIISGPAGSGKTQLAEVLKEMCPPWVDIRDPYETSDLMPMYKSIGHPLDNFAPVVLVVRKPEEFNLPKTPRQCVWYQIRMSDEYSGHLGYTGVKLDILRQQVNLLWLRAFKGTLDYGQEDDAVKVYEKLCRMSKEFGEETPIILRSYFNLSMTASLMESSLITIVNELCDQVNQAHGDTRDAAIRNLARVVNQLPSGLIKMHSREWAKKIEVTLRDFERILKVVAGNYPSNDGQTVENDRSQNKL